MRLNTHSKNLFKVLHEGMSVTSESHMVINTMMTTFTKKTISGAKKIVRLKNKKEMTSSDVKNSLAMFVPSELQKHLYSDINRKQKLNYGKYRNVINLIKREFKSKEVKITDEAYVAIFIALDGVLADVLELSGNDARGDKKKRITPNNIYRAIKNDEELHELFSFNMFVIPRNVKFNKKEMKQRNNNNKVENKKHMSDTRLVSKAVLIKIFKEQSKQGDKTRVNEFDDLIIEELDVVLKTFLGKIMYKVAKLYLSIYIGNTAPINKTTRKLDFTILNHVLSKSKIYIPNITEAYYKKSVYISPVRFKAVITQMAKDYVRSRLNPKNRQNKNFTIITDDFLRALHLVTENYLLMLISDARVSARLRNNTNLKTKNIQHVRYVRKERV